MYISLKRILDFTFSLIGLLLISPVFLILFFLLKFSGEGEVFYLQDRMGFLNKPFSILKFATMLKNSPNIGSKTITVRNDPRVTPMGFYLRMSKLNELPQIINVLKGEMSFVGPRPLLLTSFQKYKQDVQAVIYENKPGITGLGSLVFRDEEKLVSAAKAKGLDPMEYYKKHIYPYKGSLELWYYKHASFTVDLSILVLTALSLVMRNSNLVFKLFKSLPVKPETLTLEGIQRIENL